MTTIPVPFIIRDTVSPENLVPSTGFQAVMPYRDGLYRWPAQQVRRFRDAGKAITPITVTGAEPHIAQVADCERGDLTKPGAAKWAHERNQLHHDATVYVELDGVAELVSALGDEPCWLLVAWWTGKPKVPALNLPAHIRLAGVQYTSLPGYDESVIIAHDWPLHSFTDLAQW